MKKISFMVVVLGLLGALLPLQFVFAGMVPLPEIISFTAEPPRKGVQMIMFLLGLVSTRNIARYRIRGSFSRGTKSSDPLVWSKKN